MYHDKQIILDMLKKYSFKVAPEGQLFDLAGGGQSRFYLDVKKTALRAEANVHMASLLYTTLMEGPFGKVESIAGVALGGCHLASLLGLYAYFEGDGDGLNVIYVRKQAKDHGTKNLVEASSSHRDCPVVLVEDVVTTGGSSIAAVQALREASYTVAGIIAVVDRREKKDRTNVLADVPFVPIFTLDDFASLL
jgi:orotate phosphoribosyltransferase